MTTATTYRTLRKTTLYLLIAALLAVAVGLSARTLSRLGKASAATVTGKVCGNASTGNAIDTVIVISEENRTWGDVGGAGFGDPTMPYTHSVAAQCGVFANDTEINTSENSLTQYIGAWAGVNDPNGISSDCQPPSTTCSYSGNNIQRVFRNAGIPSKSYVEGATTGCSASGNAAKHIPDMYMWDPVDKAACVNEVRPLTEFNFSSPPTGFSFITPTLCNDGHDCANSTVDTWLSTRMQSIFDSPAYKAGKVFVQVWYDEDNPKPNLFACWSCGQFNNTTTNPHYSGESLLWLNLLGAPTTNLGGISSGTDIRPIVFNSTPPPPPPSDNPPAVNITAPANGATLTSSPVTISANATDDIGVTKVEFYDGSTLLNTDTTSPYTFSWNSSTLSGSQTLTAKAYDTGGHVTTSSPVSVTINNGTTCQNTPNNALGTATIVISTPAQGTYHIWSRISAADATNNSYFLQIDATCPIIVGGNAALVPNALTWVDYQDGNTGSHTTAVLSAGNHTFTMVGRGVGVGLDRVLLISDTCQPTGTGENCADSTAPTVNVTAPTAGQTVSGSSVPITASATDNSGGSGIAKVVFLVDGNVVNSSTTSPYQINWDSKTVPDGTHAIQAVATDVAGNSTTSASVSITVKNADTTPPSAPANLTSTKNVYNEVDLSWSASTDNVGVTGYRVLRNNVVIATVSATSATTYNDTLVSANTAYSYSIVAIDAANNSSQPSNTLNLTTPQAPDTQPPTAPVNLTATASSATNVNLSWSASTDNVGVTGYRVLRNNVVIATVTQTGYADGSVLPSTNYTYTVVAFDAVGNASPSSNSVSVTTPALPDTTPPSAPSNLAGSAISETQVNLTWTASSDNVGVGGYNVFRNGSKIATTNSTAFGDATVSAGQTYTYYVIAFDAANNQSAQSNQISVITPTPPPPSQQTLTISPSDDAGLHKSRPDNNYGLGSTMTADASPAESFIMKFNVTGIAGRTVSSAMLQLWNIDSSSHGGNVNPVSDNNWNEATVTWNNAPAEGTNTLYSLGSVSKNHYYLVDLSNYITADGTYSIRVDSTDTNSTAYSTRNAPTISHRPVLTVTVQ
ncbi:MAG TPA: Ig-like domain-containing protein [Patescibacteria group bacterium]|nr:Ig-like domain-containing protein [Patescibacteria group bacterium]